jgi:hypothetical protein
MSVSDQVKAQRAVEIKDAAKLPGAFLLFRFTTVAEGTFAGIAYDATITDKTTLKELQLNYIINGGGGGFPYIEKFSKLSGEGTNIWKGANQISYGMNISYRVDGLLKCTKDAKNNTDLFSRCLRRSRPGC